MFSQWTHNVSIGERQIMNKKSSFYSDVETEIQLEEIKSRILL